MFPNTKHYNIDKSQKTTYDQSRLMNISIISKLHLVHYPIHDDDIEIKTKNITNVTNIMSSRYIEGLVLLIKYEFHTLIHDKIRWKHCNNPILKS